MTVTLRDLRVMDVLGPNGSRAPAVVVRRAQPRQVAAPASMLALAAGSRVTARRASALSQARNFPADL